MLISKLLYYFTLCPKKFGIENEARLALVSPALALGVGWVPWGEVRAIVYLSALKENVGDCTIIFMSKSSYNS